MGVHGRLYGPHVRGGKPTSWNVRWGEPTRPAREGQTGQEATARLPSHAHERAAR